VLRLENWRRPSAPFPMVHGDDDIEDGDQRCLIAAG
jgi:hypothetical protein